jgi:ribosomal protein S18 acetylase RimI-like enzyme
MIRSATREDVPAIKELMRTEPGFWQDAWRHDVVERGIESAGGLAFVWQEAGQVLGFVCAHDLGFRAYLSALVVSERARSRGIGKRLVQHVEESLHERGCAILIADVWRNAAGFYQSLGWSEPEAVLLRKKVGEGAGQPGATADADKPRALARALARGIHEIRR